MRIIVKLLVISTLLFYCKTKSENSKTSALVNPAKIKVAIQPFHNLNLEYAQEAKWAIEKYYGFEVSILKPIPLPKFAENQIIKKQYYFPNLPLRYRADTLIDFLKRNLKPNYQHIVGLTNQYISCSNRDEKGKIQAPVWLNVDWQIFGLGYRPGKSCVVSMAAFHLDGVNQKQIKSRVRKVVMHELGHNLGLDHCKDKDCFMREVDLRFALKSLDLKKESLCGNCKKILLKKNKLIL
jgi:archaemetzincin